MYLRIILKVRESLQEYDSIKSGGGSPTPTKNSKLFSLLFSFLL